MIKGLSAQTKLAAVVGHPVGHSLSPILHNAWLAASDLDAVYLALDVTEAGFAAFMAGLRESQILGLNVTLPFKAAALAVADEASDIAARAGAANLLRFQSGRIWADNTDGAGLIEALSIHETFLPSQGPALLLGAGGAARGAVGALLDAGVPEVHVKNRSPDKVLALQAALGDRRVKTFSSMADPLACIVNATSLGLNGQGAPDLDWTSVRTPTLVLDMVYRPLNTTFLQQASIYGHQVIDGLAMLIGQARPSFAALFGIAPPPIDVRRLALAQLSATG